MMITGTVVILRPSCALRHLTDAQLIAKNYVKLACVTGGFCWRAGC